MRVFFPTAYNMIYIRSQNKTIFVTKEYVEAYNIPLIRGIDTYKNLQNENLECFGWYVPPRALPKGKFTITDINNQEIAVYRTHNKHDWEVITTKEEYQEYLFQTKKENQEKREKGRLKRIIQDKINTMSIEELKDLILKGGLD